VLVSIHGRARLQEMRRGSRVCGNEGAGIPLDKSEIREIIRIPMSAKFTPPLLVTNDAVTLVLNGKVFTGTRTYAENAGVLVALKNGEYQRAADLLNKANAIVRKSLGIFTIEGGTIFHNGLPIHNTVTARIVQLMDEGLPFMPAVKFLENLIENPSQQAVSELYEFLEHKGLPLTEDGYFLAYKTVASDYLSKASGSEPVEVSTDGGVTWETFVGRIPNKVGSIIRMKRNLVDDDKDRTCSQGLHVGALAYAGPNGWYHSAGDNVVIVKVNPRDAVSVPSDHSAQKLRVSEYRVLQDFEGAYTAPLTSADGEEFETSESENEVFCVNCDWEGMYAELDRGYQCPNCDDKDTIDVF